MARKYPDPFKDKKGKGETASKPDKMTERELLSCVDSEIVNSLGRLDSRLSNDRLQAMKYYLGDKTGNLAPPEAEGRSSVVSMDVADTIEWILPSLIRIFTSGENAVEYAPRKPGDEQGADQCTDWANYVFYTQNEGFITLHDWFKDALLQKLGVIKTWWDDAEDITTEEYEGLTLDELTLMLQDGTAEVIQKTERIDDAPQAPQQPGMPPMPQAIVYDVKIKRTADTSHICIENVPPEEFLFSRKARTPQRIFSCHHRVLKTVTELREAGYKNTDDLGDDDSGAEFSQEAIERESDANEFTYGSRLGESPDPSMRFVWITESYMQVDWNNDGLAEWRKIVKSGKVLLSNDEIDEHPFSMLTPIKMPHKLVGRSIADLLMDLQDIKTSLMRQFIDNTYLTNNPRQYVDESMKVNIDDLLDNRVGGIVRGKGPNGVTVLPIAPLSPVTFSLLDYLDQVKESRTGINKTFQGLSANTLTTDPTATATNAMIGAAKEKIELIARIFAETGVKDLFKKILKLTGQYQKQAQVIRLTGNKFISIDPRAWKTQYDILINVGLGTGNKDQIASHVMGIMNIQKEAMMAGLPITGAKQIYNAAAKFAVNSGFKNPGEFFIDPESPEGQQLSQQAQQKPNPEMMKMQAQQQAAQAKLQSDQAIAQQQMQNETAMNQQTMQMKQQEIQMENERQRQNDEREYAREQAKAQSDMQVKMAEIQQKYELDIQRMQHEGQIELLKHKMSTEASARPTTTVHVEGADHLAGMADNVNNTVGILAHAIPAALQAMTEAHLKSTQQASAPKTVRMKTSQGKELVGEISTAP